MGSVYYGVHKEMAFEIHQRYGLSTFVETGTWKGDSAMWAAVVFDRVYTVEIAEGFYRKAKERLDAVPNVSTYLGDSRLIMIDICRKLRRPTLFWLDAHWTGEPEYRDDNGPCPVMYEIDAINKHMKPGHAIMVDDYRLFPDNNKGLWPSKDMVIAMLENNGRRAVSITDDVFLAEPVK